MKTKLLLFAMFLFGSFASNAQCSAAFTATVNPTGAQFTITSPSSSVFYTWSFGNGTYGYGPTASCTYTTPGTYLVCCLAADSMIVPPCIDSSCSTITITTGTGSCNANFTVAPDSLAGPGNYVGYNLSTGGTTYSWNWGDGNTSTGMYPSHTYAAPGSYTICLTVTGAGCVDSVCNTYALKTGGMVTVNIKAPAGVSDVSKTAATIYPNPASDKLSIKGNSSTKYQVDIYNVSGSKVLSTSVLGNRAINIAQLPANIYMVKVTDAAGKIQYAKFTKQ